jgi:DNA polymerase-3 subunit gamma/tau
MSYLALARKWRPQRFTDLVGQNHVLRALGSALDQDRVPPALLFSGTRGVGKTSIARLLAKALNCALGVTSAPCGTCTACLEIEAGRFIDLIEVDAASASQVEDTKALLENVQYAPARGRYKVYLIDEVHMLSKHSFNALLKSLEEPPPHAKFLLCTTDPKKLPVTVLSRCLQFSLKPIADAVIAERLTYIGAAEQLTLEPSVAGILARAAAGSLRDALSLMDQLIAFSGPHLSEIATRTMLGTIDKDQPLRILQALALKDGVAILKEIERLDEDAPDYDQALAEVLHLLQRIAIAQLLPGEPNCDPEELAIAALAKGMPRGDVPLYYQIGLQGRPDLKFAPSPRLGFEMLLLRMLGFRPQGSVDTLKHDGAAAAAG